MGEAGASDPSGGKAAAPSTADPSATDPPPAGAAWGPGTPPFFQLSRLMVVAVAASSSRLVYKAQTKPNGPWESGWTAVDMSQTYGWMAAGITGDGRVAMVAQRAPGNGVSYIDEAADNMGDVERWNAPVDLGMPPGAKSIMQLAMGLDAGARVEVFALDAIGTDPGGCRIFWKYQNPNRIVQETIQVTPPGTTTPITVTVDVSVPPTTPWSDWCQIPGGLVTLRCGRNADGRIILFGINQQGHLYRCEQKSAVALAPADWTGWVQMDDGATGTIGSIAPALDSAGAVNLFAINQRAQVVHARQAPPNTASWTVWSTPGFIREGAQALAAGIDGDGHVLLVATDGTKQHNLNRQCDVQAQQWSGWGPFNATDNPVQIALDYNSDGRLTLFSHWMLPPPSYGGLWCISQMALDSTEFELGWTTLADNDIRQYAVVRDLTPPQ